MGTKTLMTVDQFLDLPEDADGENPRRYELDERELSDLGKRTYRHNWIRETILVALWSFLRGKELGAALTETGVMLNSRDFCERLPATGRQAFTRFGS